MAPHQSLSETTIQLGYERFVFGSGISSYKMVDLIEMIEDLESLVETWYQEPDRAYMVRTAEVRYGRK